MPQETAFLRQKAVLWTASGFDENGQPTVGATPTQVCCRWNRVRRQARDPKGNPITITAEVVVKQDVEPGSIMYEGSLEQYQAETSGQAPLLEVVTFNHTPDLKNRAKYRQLSLMAYRGSLPSTT